MKTIGDITNRRKEIYSVETKESALAVAGKMRNWYVRAVSVTEGGRLVGIVSEWDFLTKLLGTARDPEHTPIGEIMTPDPHTAHPGASYAECLATMMKHDFQHLVIVTESGELRGTISVGDLLRVDKVERDGVIEFYESMLKD
ncbi:MAG: CBS domain-containing protein [Acidobacteria bacterium]|nr:CBS domain-containing protein [Acidobacteriota bacterium]